MYQRSRQNCYGKRKEVLKTNQEIADMLYDQLWHQGYADIFSVGYPIGQHYIDEYTNVFMDIYNPIGDVLVPIQNALFNSD